MASMEEAITGQRAYSVTDPRVVSSRCGVDDEVRAPLVGVVCDRCEESGVSIDQVRARYLEALRLTAGLVPVLLPTGLGREEVYTILSRLDGLVLTGAESDIAPAHYGAAPVSDNGASTKADPARDATALAAINIALATDLPLLGICRGLQELNVALGGTLSQDVSQGSNRISHVEDLALPRDRQYAPAHVIRAEGGGPIARAIARLPDTGANGCARVNTLHRQGIDDLAPGLAVDARCVDGLIEAVSVRGARTFAAAVQWHPEWFHDQDPLSREIFRSFASACHARRQVVAPPAMKSPS